MKTKVLITVKTYPTLSDTYQELVCTAGIREDGSWVRIYPIPFRKLDYEKRYSKYQWITLDLIRNKKDPRLESYRPIDYEKIELGRKIGTDKGIWTQRRKVVLGKVYYDLNTLIAEAKNKAVVTSLAVFKPFHILGFEIKETTRHWDKNKLEKLKQIDLFQGAENPFEVVRKLPYEFSYKFKDKSGKPSTLQILDWEIGQLFWNCLKTHQGDEAKACGDVRKKYFDDFAKTKDLYFFLGTTREFHFVGRNPFLIIGTFHPGPIQQGELF